MLQIIIKNIIKMKFNKTIKTLIIFWLLIISSVSGITQEDKDKVKKIFMDIFGAEPNDDHLMKAIGFLIRNGGIDNPDAIIKLIEIYRSKMGFWEKERIDNEDPICGDSKCEEEEVSSCDSDCVLLTCNNQYGFICNEDQICLGKELVASDTKKCCSEQCTDSNLDSCQDCGNGHQNICDKQECYSITEKCFYDPTIGSGACMKCSLLSGCDSYYDMQSCMDNNCNFLNCKWNAGKCYSINCVLGTTIQCITSDDCEGTKACINNDWGECLKNNQNCRKSSCGNSICDSGENCSSCLDDCGACYADVEGLQREVRTKYITGNCGPNGYPGCFCGSNTEVTNYFFADRYEPIVWERCAKEDGGSPEKIFTSSGSQNFAPLARIAMYFNDHNPEWLIKYLANMRHSTGIATFMGKEFFSVTYGPPVVSGIILDHNLAIKLGHEELVKETTQYLRTYWAAYSLAAVPRNIDKTLAYTEGNIVESKGNKDVFIGYSAPHVGTRSKSDGNTELNAQPMLTFALNKHPRAYFESVLYNHNLHTVGRTSVAVGLPISNDWFVDLDSMDFPAYKFGLTEQERKILREFIDSNGEKNLDEVLAMIPDHRPIVPITYYRTENGIATWLGTSTEEGKGVNPNKPSTVFATSIEGTTASYLHPTGDREGPGVSRSFRIGNKICAESRHGNGRQCIDLPTGRVIYEVSWSPDNGIVRIQ